MKSNEWSFYPVFEDMNDFEERARYIKDPGMPTEEDFMDEDNEDEDNEDEDEDNESEDEDEESEASEDEDGEEEENQDGSDYEDNYRTRKKHLKELILRFRKSELNRKRRYEGR